LLPANPGKLNYQKPTKSKAEIVREWATR